MSVSWNKMLQAWTSEVSAQVLPTSTFLLQFLDLDHRPQKQKRKPKQSHKKNLTFFLWNANNNLAKPYMIHIFYFHILQIR